MKEIILFFGRVNFSRSDSSWQVGHWSYPPTKIYKPSQDLRSYIVKENHISSAVSKILWYTSIHRHPFTFIEVYFYLKFKSIFALDPKIKQVNSQSKVKR